MEANVDTRVQVGVAGTTMEQPLANHQPKATLEIVRKIPGQPKRKLLKLYHIFTYLLIVIFAWVTLTHINIVLATLLEISIFLIETSIFLIELPKSIFHIIEHFPTNHRDFLYVTQVVIPVFGIWLFFHQLDRNRDIARGKFLYDLHRGAEDYNELIELLETRYNRGRPEPAGKGRADAESQLTVNIISTEVAALKTEKVKAEKKKKDEETKLEGRAGVKEGNGVSKVNVRSFLKFCETMQLLLETEVVAEKEIFTLFAYRIARITRDTYVQDTYLFKDERSARSNFCAIFALDKRLDDYMAKRFRGDPQVKIAYGLEGGLRDRSGYEVAYADGLNLYYTHNPIYKHGIRKFFSTWKRRICKLASVLEKKKEGQPIQEKLAQTQ